MSTKRTAAETILLAAASFGDEPFSKWELAVKVWGLDPQRFGMRGYEKQHPDVNRVAMEIMGAKTSNPIRRGFMVAVVGKPSYYRITPNGKAAAASLQGFHGPKEQGEANDLYDLIAPLLVHPVFLRWKANPEEPTAIADVYAFFGDVRTLAAARTIIQSGIDWCRRHAVDRIAWHAPKIYTGTISWAKNQRSPVLMGDLADLDDFLTAMAYRFPTLTTKAKTA